MSSAYLSSKEGEVLLVLYKPSDCLAKSYDFSSILFNKSWILFPEALISLLAEPLICKASAVFLPADLIQEIALSIFF